VGIMVLDFQQGNVCMVKSVESYRVSARIPIIDYTVCCGIVMRMMMIHDGDDDDDDDDDDDRGADSCPEVLLGSLSSAFAWVA